METKEQTRRLNTINTVLSEDGANRLAGILHWFWDETHHEAFSSTIMAMLAIYVKHGPIDAHWLHRPDKMTLFVSELIKLKDQLEEVVNREKPWQWVGTIDGWELPPKTDE
jgi:hypothetical protein